MADLAQVFHERAARYLAQAGGLAAQRDTPTDLSFVGPDPGPDGNDVWLAAHSVEKRYVRVHLMPVYTNPELLESTSAGLRARMQGKACLNFTCIDTDMFNQLEGLLRRSVQLLA